MNTVENKSEELFKELCNQQYLKGFIFHSPKYYDPTEKETGDVVLWIRDTLIVFEIVWRNSSSQSSTKSFIRRISEKREQLEKESLSRNLCGSKPKEQRGLVICDVFRRYAL